MAINREYQKRASRQGIRSFLAQEFYRPARRPDPRPKHAPGKTGYQFVLNFEPNRGMYFSDTVAPLKDVFPQAYE